MRREFFWDERTVGRMGKGIFQPPVMTFHNAPRPTDGTESAAFAAKGYQVFGMAGVTTYPHKTMLKTAAFEVILEFPPDVIRQYPALASPLRLENGIVFFDKLVKEGPLKWPWFDHIVWRVNLALTAIQGGSLVETLKKGSYKGHSVILLQALLREMCANRKLIWN